MDDKTKEDVSRLKTRVAILETEMNGVKDTLKSIHANTTWTFRTIVGAIILAILTFLFSGGVY